MQRIIASTRSVPRTAPSRSAETIARFLEPHTLKSELLPPAKKVLDKDLSCIYHVISSYRRRGSWTGTNKQRASRNASR
jgi:hypothetical protein